MPIVKCFATVHLLKAIIWTLGLNMYCMMFLKGHPTESAFMVQVWLKKGIPDS